MSIQNDEQIWVILIISDTYTHSYLFWYYTHTTHSKFEVLIVLTFNNMHDVVDFNSPSNDIYKNQKIIMIRIRTLQYSVEGCVFALPAVFVFFVNTARTKTLNFYECFDSF